MLKTKFEARVYLWNRLTSASSDGSAGVLEPHERLDALLNGLEVSLWMSKALSCFILSFTSGETGERLGGGDPATTIR
jgi:hypothetical protein